MGPWTPAQKIHTWYPAILDFKNLKFLAVEKINRVVLHHRAKFRQNRSHYGQDMAIFRFFKTALAVILDFQIW